jgi:ADP-ribose pyrophosphatase
MSTRAPRTTRWSQGQESNAGLHHVRLTLEERSTDGTWAPVATRIALPVRRAVGILAYDPRADVIVLVRQPRPGALLASRADARICDPMLEVPAGLIEPGEDEADVARRELLEETGCASAQLLPISSYCADPEASGAIMTLFCALVTASEAGTRSGLADEFVAVELVPGAELATRLTTPDFANAATIIAVQWLLLNRERLRQP